MALLETLQDKFPGTTLNPQWTPGYTGAVGGGVSVSAGLLGLITQVGSDANTRCWVASTATYTFADSYAIAQVIPDSGMSTHLPYLKIRPPAGAEYFRMRWDNSNLVIDAQDNTGVDIFTPVTVAYTGAPMSYWRIRNTAGTLYFETGQGGTWTVHKTVTYALSATAYHLELGAAWSATPPQSRSVNFDNVNAPPQPMATLIDDFSGTTLNPLKWTSAVAGTAVTVNVNGGSLNFDTVVKTSATHSGTVTSTDTFLFTNTSITAQVTPTTVSGVPVTGLRVIGGGEQFYFIRSGASSLIMRLFNTTGTQLTTLTIAYSASTMAWWRIRHTGTVVYWETAEFDVGPWAIKHQYTYTPAGYAYNAYLDFTWVGATTATNPTNVTRFDNVNNTPSHSVIDGELVGAPTMAPTALPVETLTDAFNNLSQWYTHGTVAAPDTSGGTLNLVTIATITGSPIGGVTSVGVYDLTDSYIFAKVVTTGSTGIQSVYLTVANPSNPKEVFQIFKLGTAIWFRGYDTTGSAFVSSTATYSATNDAWWRIRHTAGIIYWETSTNSAVWTIRDQGAYAPTRAMQVRLETGFNGTSTATTMRYDNVNIGVALKPDSITNTETFGPPDAIVTAPQPIPTPDGITDTETLGDPTIVAGADLIETLQDDFSGTALDPLKWSSATTGTVITVGVAAGTLNMTSAATASAGHSGTVTSVKTFDINNSALYAKVVPGASVSIPKTGLHIVGVGNSEEFHISREGSTNLYFRGYNTTGTQINSTFVPYDATAMAYWRMRFGGGNIYWETAPADNGFWTVRRQIAYTPALRTYRAVLDMQWVTGTPGVCITRFDNVNEPVSASTIDPETFGPPTLTVAGSPPATPTPVIDAETLGDPTLTFVADTPPTTPDGIGDTEQFGDPDVAFTDPNTTTPDSIEEYEEFEGSEVVATDDTLPDSLIDPETLGNPDSSYLTDVAPDSLTDVETFGAPTPIRDNNVVTPDSLTDPETFGDVLALIDPYPAYYPDSILDIDVVTRPDSLIFRELSNWNYGEGIYSDGPYSGSEPQPEPPKPDEIDNLTYGTGTYSYGIYYGTQPAPLPDAPEPQPLLSPAAGYGQPPLHILGIGPWSSKIVWRGLPNYFINAGKYPARPALALPPATSKGFTLRLAEGSEARVDLAMARGSAIVIDEMDTDLWWRRKDPRTKELEVIGRFNCAHIEMSTSDTGVNMSAQFEDYVTVLGARMVLKYLDPGALPNPESQWGKDTPITSILEFALPTNTGLDLTEVTGPNPYPLGKTIQQYHLPPSTTIADVMSNLVSISPTAWEWWIETPADVNKPPKLRFALGGRGSDKGVTLLDAGSGPTPIAAWTRNGSADDYANSLYYTGVGTGDGKDAGGGVVEQIPADMEQYGQRDVLYGSTTAGGDIKQIKAGAVRKLGKLSDRKPTYTITLAHGFWRGRSHIDVGDTVTLILRLGNDLTITKYRVTEITVNIDDNGMEDVTLTLGKPRASNDPRSSQSPIMRMLRTLKNYEAPKGAADIPPPEE